MSTGYDTVIYLRDPRTGTAIPVYDSRRGDPIAKALLDLMAAAGPKPPKRMLGALNKAAETLILNVPITINLADLE